MPVPPGFLSEPGREPPEPQPGVAAPAEVGPQEPPLISSPVAVFPAWSGWDVVAVLVVTVLAVFGFSIVALAVVHVFPAYRHLAIAELATNAKVIVGSQAAAYPVVIVFMIGLVRVRSGQPFVQAIQWRWPGNTAPTFILFGILLAFAVVCIGVLVLRKTRPDAYRPFRVPWAPVTCTLGALVCLGMTLALSNETWLRLLFWTILGMSIYAFYGFRHSRLRQ